MIIGIDPGVNAVGIALADEHTIRVASYVEGGADLPKAVLQWVQSHIDVARIRANDPRVTFVVEKPQVYRTQLSKAPPADLVDLAWAGASVLERLRCCLMHDEETIRTPFPVQWKGNIKKPKTTKEPYLVEVRARERLTPAEISRIHLPIKSLTHNVWDAVGLVLYGAGKWKPGPSS